MKSRTGAARTAVMLPRTAYQRIVFTSMVEHDIPYLGIGLMLMILEVHDALNKARHVCGRPRGLSGPCAEPAVWLLPPRSEMLRAMSLV